jgi:hypothetical protein
MIQSSRRVGFQVGKKQSSRCKDWKTTIKKKRTKRDLEGRPEQVSRSYFVFYLEG